jgi:PIN domain nuclease of toxin-antitoxin system
LIYLDTHAVVWLYAGLANKFNSPVRVLMNEQDIAISPIVRLELQFLYEIHRVTEDADTIVADLANRIGLTISNMDFNATISRALEISWTRDPFDRIIVANASLDRSILVTKDQNILSHYPLTKW